MTTRLALTAVALTALAAHADEPRARLRLKPATTLPVARGLTPEATATRVLWNEGMPPPTVRPLTALEAMAMTPPPPPSGERLIDLTRFTERLTATPVATYETQPQVEPTAPRVYASQPAYRWYGWGAMPATRRTPTPSPAWMRESGATPGAFPLTAVGPEPEVPAAQMPVTETPRPTPPVERVSADAVTMTAVADEPVTAFDPNRPVSMTNVPPLPPGATLVDPGTVPVPTTPVPMQVLPSLPPRVEPPPEFSRVEMSAVKQAGHTETPADARPPLVRQWQAAAGSLAVVESVEQLAPQKFRVRLRSTTEDRANRAARAISALPTVLPLAVEFAITVAPES